MMKTPIGVASLLIFGEETPHWRGQGNSYWTLSLTTSRASGAFFSIHALSPPLFAFSNEAASSHFQDDIAIVGNERSSIRAAIRPVT
jgi:hypothetical protein